MKRKRRTKKSLINKNPYKLIVLIITVIFSGFFIKETAVKEYAQPAAGIISGRVIKVSDGDSVTIVNNENKRVKIRLYGIDSPELDQNYGENSKRFLAKQISGKYVTVDIIDIDQYKRSVGRVFTEELDINQIMVAEGYAWVYPQYCKIPERAQWEQLQKTARSDKKGLWSKDNPVPPWKWRKKAA